MSKGIITTKVSTARIENKSANLPAIGIIVAAVPNVIPAIRLDAVDFPLGASRCAMAIPSGNVGKRKNPVKKTLRYIQFLERKRRKNKLSAVIN